MIICNANGTSNIFLVDLFAFTPKILFANLTDFEREEGNQNPFILYTTRIAFMHMSDKARNEYRGSPPYEDFGT